MTLKLLWIPGERSYRLRAFAGQNSHRRGFAGELELPPADARALHAVIELGQDELRLAIAETGWIDPELRRC